MIRVKVRTILDFKKIFGQERFEVSLPDGGTVTDFLEKITETWGDQLTSQLFETNGTSLRPHIMLMVNGRSIRFLDNLDTVLRNEDEVLILPPVGGG